MFKRFIGWLVGLAEICFPFLRYPVVPYQERVSNTLWRGSRVNRNGILDLIARGFFTIVDLCAEHAPDDSFDTNDWKGIHFIHIPIVDSRPPTEAQANQFLNLFKESQAPFWPVFIHCEAGEGRTGCMVALYRIWVQDWTVEDALKDGARHKLCLPDQIKFIRTFCRTD